MLKHAEFIKLKRPERAQILCELAEQCFMEGDRVVITVQDDNQGVSLDRYMWVWKKGSFLPHVYDNGSVECYDEPVVIVTNEDNPNGAKVLIQGQRCNLDFARQFRKVFEFVETYDENLLQEARERFKAYRELGIDPTMRE